MSNFSLFSILILIQVWTWHSDNLGWGVAETQDDLNHHNDGNGHRHELKVDDGQDDLDRLGDGGRHLHQPHVHGACLRSPFLR